MRRILYVSLLAALGCQDMEKAQFALHQEYGKSIDLFGTVSIAYDKAASDMAGKKHDLQRQLIDRTTQGWLKEKTDKDGKVNAAELAVMLAQRDAAVVQMVDSQKSWDSLSVNYRRAVQDLLKLNATVMAKDADVEEAREQLRQAGQSVLNLIMGAATSTAITVPLLVP